MKPGKKTFLYVFLILTASLLLFLGCTESKAFPEIVKVENAVAVTTIPNVDSVSAASTYYFEENSLSAEELAEVIHNLSSGALAVATVNEDGSPNLAFAGPDMVTEDILMFGLSGNQTRKNITERKVAVVGIYLLNPEDDEGIAGSRGARLVLELIEDSGQIEDLKKLVPDAPDDVLFMQIIRVLPVG
jgi:hypothetical protein